MKIKRRSGVVDLLLKQGPQRRVRATVGGVSGNSVPDADAATKGKLRLAGDFGGTADSPVVESVSSIAKVVGLVSQLSFKEPLANLLFTYSTNTANSDPGSGKVKFNTTTLGSIATCRLSETDAYAQPVASVFDSWDNSTDPNRALVVMRKVGSNTIFRAFYLTGAYSDQGTWGSFSVSNLGGVGSFVDGDTVILEVLFGVSLPGHTHSDLAPINSPTFTGDPKAPTPATGDNDTSIATTAHVKAQPLNAFALPTADVAMGSKQFTGVPWGTVPGNVAEYSQMIFGDMMAKLGFSMKLSVFATSIGQLGGFSRTGNVLTASSNRSLAPVFGSFRYQEKLGTHGSGTGQINHAWDVDISSGGHPHVVDRGSNRVLRYVSGAYFGYYGGNPNNSETYRNTDGYLWKPAGCSFDTSDYLWIVDQTRIQKFDYAAGYVSKIVLPGTTGLGDYGGRGIHVTPGNDIYVSWTSWSFPYSGPDLHRVAKYNSSGTQLWEVGSTKGSSSTEFNEPTAIATDSSGNVYICDSGNNRIKKYSSSGTYIGSWGTFGDGPGEFKSPNGIAIDGNDDVYVSDFFNNRIQKFTQHGVYISMFGRLGSGNGQMAGPNGLEFDGSGNLWLADRINSRAQKFVPFTLPADKRVLVRHETTYAAYNNIYVVTNPGGPSTPWVLTLADDAMSATLKRQSLVISQYDDAAQNMMFTLTTPEAVEGGGYNIFTDPLTWDRFQPGGPPTPHGSNHSPGGTDPVETGAPVSIGTSNQEGTATSLARSDHVHAPPPVEPRWIVGGGGSNPAFQNSWTNYGGSYAWAAFWKDPLGRVYLEGLIAGGLVNNTVFTLPSGYRPAGQIPFGVENTGVHGRVDVNANGTVVVVGGSNAYVSLNNISFRAA